MVVKTTNKMIKVGDDAILISVSEKKFRRVPISDLFNGKTVSKMFWNKIYEQGVLITISLMKRILFGNLILRMSKFCFQLIVTWMRNSSDLMLKI